MVLDIMLEMKKPDYTTDVINLALSKLTKKQVYEFNFTEAEETSRLINSKVTSEDAKILQGFYLMRLNETQRETINSTF